MYPVYDYIGEEKTYEDIPLVFPAQHQESQPGYEYLMDPPPLSQPFGERGCRRLEGRTAVIAGGDSGIGRAVAYAFAAEGARLIIGYLDEQEDARETKGMVESLGGSCELLAGDLRDPEQARRLTDLAMETYGSIDILVNSIAVQFVKNNILEVSPDQLQTVFQTNVYSYIYLIQAALPYMKAGGSIINTASVTAFAGEPKLIDYSASKGAIVFLTRSLILSLFGNGTRVNAVAPGTVWTPLISSSFPQRRWRPSELINRLRKIYFLSRVDGFPRLWL